MVNKHITIAIDGPAGCGKSTVAKEISKRLGIVYLDTGSMYRAVAYCAMQQGINMESENDELLKMLGDMSMEIVFNNGIPEVYVNGSSVSAHLRTKEIAIGASFVAKLPVVRKRMVELQREIASKNSVVMDGRDIGTKVLADSENKFFLTASVEVRAQRRFSDEKDTGITLEEVAEDIKKRDESDITRSESPLVKAEDAMEIDTSDMTVNEVVNTILKRVEENVL